ncbi:MAG: O-antigen ligase family protein [Bacteroidota bacterium]|nr:O-antigen ligase family protein [Bacteroidota bacterium]
MKFEVIEKFYRQFIRTGYVFGICLLVVSLAHSKYGLSVSQFFLAGSFALERINLRKLRDEYVSEPRGRFLILLLPRFLASLVQSIFQGLKAFIHNKPAWVFSSILLFHILGLIYTTDFEYAFKDLRTKLPIFLLPLFISTSSAFGRKNFYQILLLFSAAVVVRTLINSWTLFQGDYVDIRDVSKSVSHIILGLLISMVLFIQAFLIIKKPLCPLWVKILSGLTIVWLCVYLVITEAETGIVVTGLTFIILMCVLVFRSRYLPMKLGLTFIIVVAAGSAILYFMSVRKDYYSLKPVDLRHLETVTRLGNPYTHNINSHITENGNPVYLYIQWDELRFAWNKRSKINFDSLDKRNQPITFTILRFLTSKGYRKDAEGISKLTDKEVDAIEKGVANYIFLEKFSLRGRIYELLWGYDEYRKTGNPTGSSLMQRLEFWRASVHLIRENWLLGVGTGDMNESFQKEYEKMHSKLAPDQRWRSHDQFLSICVGFGLFGLAWFLLAILYPPARLNEFMDYFFLIFFIIAMISMIPEDTIESQAGVTFFAFFYSFFLFGRKEDDLI